MPAVPATVFVGAVVRCPRCGTEPRLFVNESEGGTSYFCAACEWDFTLGTQAPTGTANATLAVGGTAISVASGGASFTGGMILLTGTGTAAEVLRVTATGSATSIPVTAVAKAHTSGSTFGQLLVSSILGTAAGLAAVPANPSWGF